MAKRYFKGTMDLAQLSMSDLSRATAALSTLEEMAKTGLLTFTMGVARSRKVAESEDEMIPGPPRVQPQQQQILDFLADGSWRTAAEIGEALKMNKNSTHARLAVMAEHGWLRRDKRARRDRVPGPHSRRYVLMFSRPDAGAGREA